LDVEFNDVRAETDRVEGERSAAFDALKRAQHSLDATRIARQARESELASARIEHEWRASQVRAREHELAGMSARLTSLEQLDAARAGFGDAARAVLANANGKVNQKGAVADYLEVEAGYERAVDACCSDLLQHVIVEHPEHAMAGFGVVRDANAGRCGFLIASDPAGVASGFQPDGLACLTASCRSLPSSAQTATTPRDHERRRRRVDCRLAEHARRQPVDHAAGRHARRRRLPRPPRHRRHRPGVARHSRDQAGDQRSRERIAVERDALATLSETEGLEATIAQAPSAIDALAAEHHKQEKAIVAHDARLQQSADEAARIAQKLEVLTRERRQAEEERETIERRQGEARLSITRLENDQQTADERLSAAQRRLFEARESAETLSQRAAEARASHAGLVERAAALAGEVERLEEAGAELEARAVSIAAERDDTRRRIEDLRAAIVACRRKLDEDIVALDGFRRDVAQADLAAADLRAKAEEHEGIIKQARDDARRHSRDRVRVRHRPRHGRERSLASGGVVHRGRAGDPRRGHRRSRRARAPARSDADATSAFRADQAGGRRR
jgi:chromosome segregation protein